MTTEIRTYTLATAAALDAYATVHWQRHIPSLAKHGITTHRVFKELAGVHSMTGPPGAPQYRLVAIVSYQPGADPAAVTRTYMTSPEFRADMAGFDMSGIVGVSSVFVEAAASDPNA